MDLGRERALRDEFLVVRCQLGEKAAFEELIRVWSGPLSRHVRRVAGADVADDLVQEIWIKVLRGIASLRDGGKLKSWLFGIAHHAMMDHLRLRYAEPGSGAEVEEAAEEETESSEEILHQLETALAALPVLERETLTLFYLEELPLAEIAAIQAVPAGTVKSRLFRARGMLRERMKTKE